jgi:thiol-disulfide isomerase/thioredoxin
MVLLLGLLGLLGPAVTDGNPGHDTNGPEERVKALTDEYDAAHQAYIKARSQAKTALERAALSDHPGSNPDAFSAKFLKLARDYPGTKTSEEALVWIASHTLTPYAEEVRGLLIRDHIRSPRLGLVLPNQSRAMLSKSAETLLRDAITKHTEPVVQGQAAYFLAILYKARANMARSYQRLGEPKDYSKEEREALHQSFDRQYGPGWRDSLRADPAALDRKAESLFVRVAKEYGDLPHNDPRSRPGLLRDAAASFLRDLQGLSIGKTAPEIDGTDLEGKRFRLSESRGKVVVIVFGGHFYCGPCRALYPMERSLARKYDGQRFAIVSIETGRDGDALRNCEALRTARLKEGLTWRCVWDGAFDGPINTAWNVQTYPTVYVIDRTGVIRDKEISIKELDRAVGRLLGEGGTTSPSGDRLSESKALPGDAGE